MDKHSQVNCAKLKQTLLEASGPVFVFVFVSGPVFVFVCVFGPVFLLHSIVC